MGSGVILEQQKERTTRPETFMRDIQKVSKALSVVTTAVKLNYEIHGNTLPHLHMHFFPRYAGDPFAGPAIEPRRVTQPVYAPGQYSEMRDRLVKALDDKGCSR